LDPNPGRKRWGIRAFIWQSSDIHLTFIWHSWYIMMHNIVQSKKLISYLNHHSWGFVKNLKSQFRRLRKSMNISNPPFMNFKNHRSCRLGSCLGCIRGGKSWNARSRRVKRASQAPGPGSLGKNMDDKWSNWCLLLNIWIYLVDLGSWETHFFRKLRVEGFPIELKALKKKWHFRSGWTYGMIVSSCQFKFQS
jgi:hypothetical protein